jgi:hypothetical protein
VRGRVGAGGQEIYRIAEESKIEEEGGEVKAVGGGGYVGCSLWFRAQPGRARGGADKTGHRVEPGRREGGEEGGEGGEGVRFIIMPYFSIYMQSC